MKLSRNSGTGCRNTYLPTKFPVYILKKAGVLKGGRKEAERIAEAFKREALED